MIIKLDLSALQQGKWYQYALRFLLGGLISDIAALIAVGGGPAVGGLFLAFPAILPAAATLIASHEREKKAQKGLHGEIRGRNAAALDAAGAAMGSIGLVVFAGLVWWLVPSHKPALVFALATVAWLTAGVLVWFVWKHRRHWRRN